MVMKQEVDKSWPSPLWRQFVLIYERCMNHMERVRAPKLWRVIMWAGVVP